ncbi:rab escort protein 1-like [Lycium ferocissimum]|uniref:rab escort protein 1-like n=1 Tax=Lycium ferocissimum TaxID=112874 RepID=UPI002814CC36|nr:rab escort protein 1-like [Lycium ferocissimum]
MISQASGCYKGVCLASEQELFSNKLILAPSFVVQSPPPHSSPDACDFGSGNTTEKLARSICISKHSLKLDVANCLAFFPPRWDEAVTCSHQCAVRIPVSGSSGDSNSADDQIETGDAKPALLWSALYTQELAKFQDVLDNIICTPCQMGVLP